MRMATGGASGRPHRRYYRAACQRQACRVAMEVARRALDEPGIVPGDDAWAEHERLRIEDEERATKQGQLALRVIQ